MYSELLPSVAADREIALLGRGGDSLLYTHAGLEWLYHDFAHVNVVDRREPSAVRKQAVAESTPDLPFADNTSVTFRGRRLALRIGWRRRGLYGSWYNVDEQYAVRGRALTEDIFSLGWAGNERVRAVCRLGATVGTSPRAERGRGDLTGNAISGPISDVLERPRLNYFLGFGGSAGSVDGALYGAKGIRQAAMVRVVNRSNGARVDFPLVLVGREAGAGIGLRLPVGYVEARGTATLTHSDTTFRTASDLPTTFYLQGIGAGANAVLGELPFEPSVETGIRCYRWGARGYDTDGTTRYAHLDTNTAILRNGEVSFVPGWGVRTGVFAELGISRNATFGRIELYPFSSMTFFRPTKYRLDSLDLSYRMVGGFAHKRFSVGARHYFDIDIALSQLVAEGFLHTRDYSYSLMFIPRLVNPKEHRLFSEDLLLLVPRLGYALSVGPVRAILSVRQLIPFDRGGRGDTKEPKDKSNITRRSRGGTSFRLDVRYSFGGKR